MCHRSMIGVQIFRQSTPSAAAFNSNLRTPTCDSGYPFMMYEALPAMALNRPSYVIIFSCSSDVIRNSGSESV